VAPELQNLGIVKVKLSYNDYLILLGIVVAIIVSITTLFKAFREETSELLPAVSGISKKPFTAKVGGKSTTHMVHLLKKFLSSQR
jgi:hypothetical protein